VGGPALDSLPERLAVCLQASEPAAKLACVHALQADWQAGRVDPAPHTTRIPIEQPGHPEKPLCVPPHKVPRRRADTVPGRAALGHAYGDFAAHNGLWDMALKTAHDPLVRMALVPRVLEARGLDATPLIVDKLRAANDLRMVEILAVIERDEIGHVAIGSRWFGWLCAARGLEPEATFRQLLVDYDAPPLKPPFNLAARRRAGFSEPELAWLSGL
jgi:uncharacterized ferritin-like protein (DUF455 family)